MARFLKKIETSNRRAGACSRRKYSSSKNGGTKAPPYKTKSPAKAELFVYRKIPNG